MTTEPAIEVETEYEVWLIIGNANGWARGNSFRKALAGMIKETGHSSAKRLTEMVIYRWSAVPLDRVKDIWVDDFGTTHYPIIEGWDNTPKKYHERDDKAIQKLVKAFTGFDEAVEEYEYGRTMTNAFES